MNIIINEHVAHLSARAHNQNRLLIIFMFLIPLIFFTGYLIAIIAMLFHFIMIRYLTSSTVIENFFEMSIPILLILPIVIFYLVSRLFKAKRLLLINGALSLEDHIIRAGDLNLPIGRIKIVVPKKVAFLPKKYVLVEIYFDYGKYLYKRGYAPNFANMRELRLSGIKSIRSVRIGSSICLYVPLTRKQLAKFVKGIEKHAKYFGVKFKTKSKKMRDLFKNFEEKSNARIIVKDFTMIGF